MSNLNSSDDKFLKELETSVLAILKNRKASKADRLSAINAGIKLAAIKHKVANGGDDDEGFFSK